MHKERRCTMAIYHCSIQIIGRSKGKSAVASAAYRSGQNLYDEETGLTHDFTKKRGVVFTEVALPAYAPPEYASRDVLWNAVQKAEKKSDAQLAREIEVALPNELSMECQIEIVRRYVQENFISAGMCADWALHNKGDGNPHAHIMLTTRGIKPDGTWAAKEKKAYALDDDGKRIPLIDPATGGQKLGRRNEKLWKRITVDANGWNDRGNAEIWRRSWADICNEYLSFRQWIDHRSYRRQGVNLEPSIHEGYRARKMEKAGCVSDRCEYNRIVKVINALKAEWLQTVRELQQTIMEKGRILYERIREHLGGNHGDFQLSGGNAGHTGEPAERAGFPPEYNPDPGRIAEEAERRKCQAVIREPDIIRTESAIADTESAIAGIMQRVKEKARKRDERIRKLKERRRAVEAAGGAANGERGLPAFDKPKGESDTDAFIRQAKAEIADTVHAVNDSRARARDSELERSYRQLSRERPCAGGEWEAEKREPASVSREYESTRYHGRGREKGRER
jgi:hypothetical protein